jgi:hypothetical protein
MNISESLNHYHWLVKAALALLKLPKARLDFYSCIAPCRIQATYKNFTRRHSRYPLIKNKTMGIALIDLSNFKSSAEYLATVKQKDYAAYHGKIARRRGYTVRKIDRNNHIQEIHEINTSLDARQGRPMDMPYLTLQTEYDNGPPFQCYGVFDIEGRLMGYCSFGTYGNFAATERILGHKNNDGFMYLLLLEIICSLIDQGALRFFMYDTFMGAQPGLKNFKKRIGFQPYRVSYTIN